MTEERRHEARIDTLNLVQVGHAFEDGELRDLTVGRTLDLSQDGVRVELSHQLPSASQVTLSLAVGDRLLDFRGVVRSVAVQPNGAYAHGIEFREVAPKAREALAEFLADKDRAAAEATHVPDGEAPGEDRGEAKAGGEEDE